MQNVKEDLDEWGGLPTTCCVCLKTCCCIEHMAYSHAAADIKFRRETQGKDKKKLKPWWNDTSQIKCWGCCYGEPYKAAEDMTWEAILEEPVLPNGECQPLFDVAPRQVA